MTRAPRSTTALLAVLVTLVGLRGRTMLSDAVGGPLGDTLFAVLLVLLVTLVRPRTSPVGAAVVGLATCAVIELSHLTDLPAAAVSAFPPARFVLGTTFTPQDLLWYALGAAAGGGLVALLRPRPRGIDLSLRHVRASAAAPRRRARVVVPVVVLAVAAGGGALAWTLRTEARDLSAQVVVAQRALHDSADRVSDDAVRDELAASVGDARAVLAATPLLDRLPGDAPEAGARLEQDVAAVERSRLVFARAQAGETRADVEPLTRRAAQVLAATDDLAAAGDGADESARAATRGVLRATDDLLAQSGDDVLETASLGEVEELVATLRAQRDALDDATVDLMTAQDAVVCPEPDQVWFPQAGKLAEKQLAAIPWAPQHSVRADVLDGLVALDEAYQAEFGQHLTVNSAYRSHAQQVEVYNPDDPNPLAAPPGCSNHGLGTAVDLSMGPEGFDGARYAWLKEHAEQHGWTHPDWAEPDGRLPEPWHWQSVTTPVEY